MSAFNRDAATNPSVPKRTHATMAIAPRSRSRPGVPAKVPATTSRTRAGRAPVAPAPVPPPVSGGAQLGRPPPGGGGGGADAGGGGIVGALTTRPPSLRRAGAIPAPDPRGG